jgi:hypothetical protein
MKKKAMYLLESRQYFHFAGDSPYRITAILIPFIKNLVIIWKVHFFSDK